MSSYIAPKLPNRLLPVTKGTDRVISIQRLDGDGIPQHWNCNVFIDIDIDKTSPTRIVGEVTDDVAVIRIESIIADQCKNSTTWRAVMSEAGDPTLETPLMVGLFERNDGKP